MSRVVLFDFDGVLVAGDSFAGWLRRHGLRPLLRRLIAMSVAPMGLALLSWRRTLPLGARLFLNIATRGANPSALRQSLDDYGRALARRPDKVIADGVRCVREHLDAGDRVIVVSGTEATLLHAVLDELQIRGVDVLASQLDFEGARVRVRRHCFGPAKLAALREAGIRAPWDLAYSDSPHDLPMLQAARAAVCVNWRAADHELASQALGTSATHVCWR
jgi:phosphatidylglycerophosphatase C